MKNIILPQHDVIGQAGKDFMENRNPDSSIKVWSDIAETDILPVHYLFRDFHQMPDLEQKALILCRGKVLDVGAGMGSHALYLQKNQLEVTALELSPLACEVMKNRDVKHIVNADFFDYPTEEQFDTILMLMNGIGIVGSVDKLQDYFQVLKRLLKPGGQVLLDSSDLRYLFLNDDGSILLNLNDKYYGEVVYKMSYGSFSGKKFPWLFIDDELLGYYAHQNGFEFEKVAEGPHFDYLARLFIPQ
ncbi:SAM-dependent methyltransferase [Natronoflexus pectinivorans]|uniref:Methyltransferase family protein n=1 Tax=Natronoflexus pectinivorans TaxID=682526 RepID=A0A4R2GJR8_9BACT|nr:class I SAM-dependent methyltransferase [Natronoflexus pectinivorans]TCO08807.1 methyltransferase family protein [Natronoflexus pectinivorans]